MVIEPTHVRVLFLVAAVGVLFLLRKPLAYPEKPGSTGFFLVVVAMAFWLGSEGLTYFVPAREPTLVLYNVLLFSITVCFVGWFLMAYEFRTQRLPSRPVLLLLAVPVLIHFVGLWTNFFWLHELIYRQSLTVENAIVVPSRGPAYWFHPLSVYVLIVLSTALFVVEATGTSGLRRRQAGLLAVSPLPGLALNIAWFTELYAFPFDLTPVGVALGGVFLTWALYRTEFLEVAPVARETVVEEMPEAVVTLDEGDRVVDWNPAATGLFGVDAPVVGMPASAFFDSIPAETLAELPVTDQTEIQLAVDLDGRERHLSISVSPVDVGRLDAVSRVVVVREITATKRREQQLLRQNEYLDGFASVVSHDIQGPLMEIRGSADVATKTGDVSHIDHVSDAVDRMDRLVADLLRLARSGQQIEDPEPVSLAAISAAAWRRVWSADADCDVVVDATILADASRLQQLLENLFRNAVEHGGRDVQVTVGSLPDGFYVEDDGLGISAEERPRVFERGYSSSDDGTGMGLEIVRQIVRAHNWTVLVKLGPAGGTRFEITGVEEPY